MGMERATQICAAPRLPWVVHMGSRHTGLALQPAEHHNICICGEAEGALVWVGVHACILRSPRRDAQTCGRHCKLAGNTHAAECL
jgi:hypothetical protein